MYLFREEPISLTSSVRILHAIPKVANVDIYASGNLIATNVPFGEVSEYKVVEHGEYEFQIYPAGIYDNPIYSETIYIYPKSFSTLALITDDKKPTILQLKDSTSISNSSSLSFVRFINLSPNAPLLNLALPNGEVLFNSVEYAETTGYYPLSPGIYDFKVQVDPAEGIFRYINDTHLEPGNFYTVYIVGLLKGKPNMGYCFVIDGK